MAVAVSATADGVEEDAWRQRFVLLWMDLQETLATATETVTQLRQDEENKRADERESTQSTGNTNAQRAHNTKLAQLEKVLQSAGMMLSTAEEIIRIRILDRSGKDGEKTSNSRPHEEATGQQENPLDQYLDGIQLSQAFVDSVRGWEANGEQATRCNLPTMEDFDENTHTVKYGVLLQDALISNRSKLAAQTAHTCSHFQQQNGQHLQPPSSSTFCIQNASGAHNTSTQSQTSVVPNATTTSDGHNHQKKRKRSASSASSSVVQRMQPPSRSPSPSCSPLASKPSESTLLTAKKFVYQPVAEQIIDVRVRANVNEYQIKWVGEEELTWIPRRKCGEETRKMISEFNKERYRDLKRQRRHEAKMHASVLAIEEDETYIVDKIVDHRFHYGKKQYLVKWDGYDSSDNTWECADQLRDDVAELVDQYEQENAKKSAAVSPVNVVAESLPNEEKEDGNDKLNTMDKDESDTGTEIINKDDEESNAANDSESELRRQGAAIHQDRDAKNTAIMALEDSRKYDDSL